MFSGHATGACSCAVVACGVVPARTQAGRLHRLLRGPASASQRGGHARVCACVRVQGCVLHRAAARQYLCAYAHTLSTQQLRARPSAAQPRSCPGRLGSTRDASPAHHTARLSRQLPTQQRAHVVAAKPLLLLLLHHHVAEPSLPLQRHARHVAGATRRQQPVSHRLRVVQHTQRAVSVAAGNPPQHPPTSPYACDQ
jgi:hypothetical protein